ncbi:MAG: CBS domain-containing protein, partial [Lachnospiraceae bacterium]|nr:CBS domain-containing protein [Lachnospiraceae bacterium]
MINNIIEFGDKTAGDIMTHRKNIIAIDASMTFEAAWHMMLEENVSRFPVYDEEIDNIIGILHYRDAAKAYENVEKRKLTVMAFKDILYDAYLIPETRNIDTLFAEMQTNKQHMAIVVDEYGQTAGVVTMEDILEEIVGNIFDEFDEEEEYITKQEDDTYMADGLTMLEDLEDTISMKFECEEIETLNGFFVSQIGKIPSADEDIEVEYGGYIFKVLNIDDRIIGDVIIKKSRSTSDLNDQNE